MKKTLSLLSLLIFTSLYACSQNPPRLRRADSFFGVHFDFHAKPGESQIGNTLTEAMVENFLEAVKPDFIQVDAKGHPGIASYPTKVGVPAAGFAKDPLELFRKVTARKGVGLYAHFSGIVDEAAIKKNPGFARLNRDGRADGSVNSLFGRYTDTYLIPQIKELSDNYRIDGVWLDGEAWAIAPDFSPAAKSAYLKATGRQANLDKDYMQFTRDAFRSYLDRYVTALHKHNPKLQIASNWAYSSFMPGSINAGVDFLSGDIVFDDIRNVEFESRVLAVQGKPWDLMIWGFMGGINGQGHYWKTARQLQQKAAGIISQGGAFQVYLDQNRDASLPVSQTKIIKDVADFSRARKPYCFKANAIPQVAILFSGPGHDHELGTNHTFNQTIGGNDNIKGMLSLLLNSQYSVQVMQEHNLKGQMSKYPLIVVTEWNFLEPQLISELSTYVRNGGKLLVVGGVSGNMFQQILPENTPLTRNNAAGLPIQIRAVGKGTIAAIDANISLAYFNTPDEKVRSSVAGLVAQLFPAPLVTVTGAQKAHVTLNTVNKRTMIHLVNAGEWWKPVGNNIQEFQLPALGSLALTYKSPTKPAQILLQPGNTALNFTYANGLAKFTVPGVDIYSIVEVR